MVALGALAGVTVLTIIHNFASDLVWVSFKEKSSDERFSNQVFWHTFSYALPLLPLCFVLIGRQLEDDKALDMLASVLVLLFSLMASGLSTSSFSQVRKFGERRRVDGEWQPSWSETKDSTVIRNAKLHMVAGIIIAIGWWGTLLTFYL